MIYQTWMDDRACSEETAELFFPDKGHSADAARAICAGCPVRERCLDYALDPAQALPVLGIWAGLTVKQLRDERRARGGRANIERPHGVSRYRTDGCRCGVCKAARAAYQREHSFPRTPKVTS